MTSPVGRFVNEHRRRGWLHRGHAAKLHQLLTDLRARGVVGCFTRTNGRRVSLGRAAAALRAEPEGRAGSRSSHETKSGLSQEREGVSNSPYVESSRAGTARATSPFAL